MNEHAAAQVLSVPVSFATVPGSAATLTRDSEDRLVLKLEIQLDPTMLYRMAGYAVTTDDEHGR